MKILLVDPLSYKGHVNYNHGIIRAISSIFDYGIIVNQYIAEELKARGVREEKFVKIFPAEWGIESLCKKMNKWLYHIFARVYFLKVIFLAWGEKTNYDIILFTSIDIYSFVFVSFLFRKKCYVVDHAIGNISNNRVYRCAWRIVNKNIRLIVLEEFIRDMVLKILRKRTVLVLRHPLPEVIEFNETNVRREDKKILFAPSSSNDESFLQQLCVTPIPEDYQIIAKSQQFEYSSENLLIYKSHLSGLEYQGLLLAADFILIPYLPSYNYRVSGVLFEAMRLGKPVLLRINNTLINYCEVFKGSICPFTALEEMFRCVHTFAYERDETLLIPYSDEAIAASLFSMIE